MGAETAEQLPEETALPACRERHQRDPAHAGQGHAPCQVAQKNKKSTVCVSKEQTNPVFLTVDADYKDHNKAVQVLL